MKIPGLEHANDADLNKTCRLLMLDFNAQIPTMEACFLEAWFT